MAASRLPAAPTSFPNMDRARKGILPNLQETPTFLKLHIIVGYKLQYQCSTLKIIVILVPITPAANVEGKEDGNNMLSDGDDVIKTLNLQFMV